MTDKKKQLDLNLGKVDFITDPNYVPPRDIDKLDKDNLTTKDFFNLVEHIRDHVDFDFGQYEGDDLLVVDCWDDLYTLYGAVNGFEGLGDRPYLSSGESFESKLKELQKEYNSTPEDQLGTRYRLERQINNCDKWIQFNAYLDYLEVEPVDLDSFGFEVVFSDEYSRCACGNCDNIVRTSPDSYSWTAPLFIDGEGYISDDCVCDGDFDQDILEQYQNEQKSIPDVRSPEDLGLVKVNEESFENGLYGGQNDTPEPIIEALNDQNIDVWFKVYPRQFDCDFDVYVRTEDHDRAKQILEGIDTELDYDPAEQMKKALQNIPPIDPNANGVTVNSIDVSTGTVKTKVVSKQDFIDGKALDD